MISASGEVQMKKTMSSSRRKFLKGAALPTLAIVGLAFTGPAMAGDDCHASCSGSCYNGCTGSCMEGCTGSCMEGCTGGSK